MIGCAAKTKAIERRGVVNGTGLHIELLATHEARRVLARLSRFHYRAGCPASPSRVLAALDERGGPVGVLCTSFPVLNAPWRERAWPGLFDSARTGSARAHLLNDYVRTIARVIVDPRWRGMGVASGLVRAYLRAPETPLTEAVASMGRFCPFFEAAGMRLVASPSSRRDVRFGGVLSALGVPALSLVEVSSARRALREHDELARAVRAWARASKSTRRHVRADARRQVELTVLAAQGAVVRSGGGHGVFVAP